MEDLCAKSYAYLYIGQSSLTPYSKSGMFSHVLKWTDVPGAMLTCLSVCLKTCSTADVSRSLKSVCGQGTSNGNLKYLWSDQIE